MSRTTKTSKGFGMLGAVVWLAACGAETMNNYAGCGVGTTLDPDTNTCVAVESAGSGGSGGSAGASGGGGTAGGSAGAQADAGGEVGDGAVAEEGGGGVQPNPGDDACLTGVEYLINGDKACGTYNAINTCSATEPGTLVLEPLTTRELALADPWDTSTGGVWVRTPSRPGVNPICGIGCSRAGTIAKILIPVIGVGFDPEGVYAAHEDQNNEMAPWKITMENVDGLSPGCWKPEADCFNTGVPDGEHAHIILETDQADAPARNFHIFAHYKNGACNDLY